jgi:hypothetical protein
MKRSTYRRSTYRRLAIIRRLGAIGILLGIMLDGGLPAPANASCSNASVRVGLSEALPDCRSYEQVSPVDKEGFPAYPHSAPAVQLSSSGEAIAYRSLAGFPGALGSTANSSAHVSKRTPNGWITTEWTPKLPKAEPYQNLSYTFSEDLSQAVLRVPFVLLTPEATPYAANLFLRSSTGAYTLINSAAPARSVEEICGPEGVTNCWSFIDVSVYGGASSDFSHVMFESNGQLTPESSSAASLYENVGGKVRLIGILPDGTPAASSTAGAEASIYGQYRNIERATSRDGSHVIFQAPADAGLPDPKQQGETEVYDRLNSTETIETSTPDPEATPAVSNAEPATFQTASVDGSRVFFTTSAELTTPSNTGEMNNSEDLYEYNLSTHHLTDLTVDTSPEDATTGAMVQGVVGSAQDGSYIYFVANGLLVEGKGIDGQPNLYMVHDGAKPVFVTTLDSRGSCNFSNVESADSCDWSSLPSAREAYVTPDGKHMAFMSTNRLSTINFPGGYDNLDQETGDADSEVYEYTAPTRPQGIGQLVCASCDQTGAQPVSGALIGGISATGISEGRVGLTGVSTPFSRVRALSDDGSRLFYSAAASLTTPYNSIYEYEQDGEGSCERIGGCQNLLSDPHISEGDYFLGASANGNDVYLATSSRLTSTDLDNVRDIYDARVNGGFAPPSIERQCESECTQASRVQPDQPVSTDAVGSSGNISIPRATPKPVLRKQCRRGFRLANNRCVKIKHARKHKARRKIGAKAHGKIQGRR